MKPDGSRLAENEYQKAQQNMEALARQQRKTATPLGGKASDVYFIRPQAMEKEQGALMERYSTG